MWVWLIFHTVCTSALAILVLAAGRFLRLRPSVRHVLWLLVLLKLLTPPLIAWPWTLPLLTAEQPEPHTAPLPRETPPVLVDRPAPRPNALPTDMLLSLPEEEPEVITETVVPRRDRAADVAVSVWLCGALAMALVQLRRLAATRRLLAHARPAPPWLASMVTELAGRLGVRPPRVQTLAGLGSPVIWSGGRARLLWPEGLEDRLTAEGRRAVLIHELAHLARRDHWVGWLLLAAGCVWWWHPLFYLVRRQLHRHAELACDAWVVATLPEARRSYAEALLEVCQRQSETAAAAPALGAAGRRRDLERRLIMIMREEASPRLRLRVLVGVCLLGLLVLPTLTLGGGDNPPKEGQPRAADRDRQLRELEQKLQAVLKDLQAQRKTATPKTEALLSPVTQRELSVVQLGSDSGIPTEREKKLRELEGKVKELLKEVQALRSATRQPIQRGDVVVDLDNDGRVDLFVTNERNFSTGPVEITLSRTTYRLPTAKAAALGKFLQEHVKAAVLETKVDGDSLTVTTTPEVQRAIGQFVVLVQGRPLTQGTPIGKWNYQWQKGVPQGK